MRGSSLAYLNIANANVGSKYDVIKTVADKLPLLEAVLAVDWQEVLHTLTEAQSFTGITVASGPVAGWDPITKLLTVPTVQGVQGDSGADGIDGVDGINGTNGVDGAIPNVEFFFDAEGNLDYRVTGYIGLGDATFVPDAFNSVDLGGLDG